MPFWTANDSIVTLMVSITSGVKIENFSSKNISKREKLS